MLAIAFSDINKCLLRTHTFYQRGQIDSGTSFSKSFPVEKN